MCVQVLLSPCVCARQERRINAAPGLSLLPETLTHRLSSVRRGEEEERYGEEERKRRGGEEERKRRGEEGRMREERRKVRRGERWKGREEGKRKGEEEEWRRGGRKERCIVLLDRTEEAEATAAQGKGVKTEGCSALLISLQLKATLPPPIWLHSAQKVWQPLPVLPEPSRSGYLQPTS